MDDETVYWYNVYEHLLYRNMRFMCTVHVCCVCNLFIFLYNQPKYYDIGNGRSNFASDFFLVF